MLKKYDRYNVGEMNFKVLFYKDLLDENWFNYMKMKVNKFECFVGFEFKFLEFGKFFFFCVNK